MILQDLAPSRSPTTHDNGPQPFLKWSIMIISIWSDMWKKMGVFNVSWMSRYDQMNAWKSNFVQFYWNSGNTPKIWELARENRKEEIHIYYIYLIYSIFLSLESTGWQNGCSSGLGKFRKVTKCSFNGKMNDINFSVQLNMIYMIPEDYYWRFEVVWTDIHIILLSNVIFGGSRKVFFLDYSISIEGKWHQSSR